MARRAARRTPDRLSRHAASRRVRRVTYESDGGAWSLLSAMKCPKRNRRVTVICAVVLGGLLGGRLRARASPLASCFRFAQRQAPSTYERAIGKHRHLHTSVQPVDRARSQGAHVLRAQHEREKHAAAAGARTRSRSRCYPALSGARRFAAARTPLRRAPRVPKAKCRQAPRATRLPSTPGLLCTMPPRVDAIYLRQGSTHDGMREH